MTGNTFRRGRLTTKPNQVDAGVRVTSGVEQRAMRGVEIRAVEVDGQPGVTLHCIRPGVVDDYGSLWMADAFDASLARRLPTLCWAHDWSEPLGPAVSYETSDQGPSVAFRFSDFDDVPQARRAWSQVKDGTIQDCSVGFWNTQRRDPTDQEKERYPGIREVIIEADLDEVSLVLRGAVPGANVLAVRSPKVAVDEALEVYRRVQAGEITAEEGKGLLDLMAKDDDGGDGTPPADGDGGGGGDDGSEEEQAAAAEQLDAEADAALALLDRSALR